MFISSKKATPKIATCNIGQENMERTGGKIINGAPTAQSRLRDRQGKANSYFLTESLVLAFGTITQEKSYAHVVLSPYL
ncbi:hypothetical protein E2C01_039820 [Portunus trituberculatus]|uniref:Uncharacterized protein n=1 Tax=Portunus trituberculatus TaxID=210409 RepID=A0A5B7FFR4_PORTR|nr:hypothetical protein [Portunus trituberculatus]